jgi:RimK family alpha-L-glutamate ligase
MSVIILSKYKETSYNNERLLKTFDKAGLDVKLMHPNKFDVIVNKGKSLRYEGEKFETPDLVLIRTGSATSLFATSVIKQFEQDRVQCINSSDSINISKNKLESYQRFASSGLPIPNTLLVRHPVDLKLVEDHIGFPCVVKVITGSQGQGVHLCETKKAFKTLMDFISQLASPKTLVVQEYIDTQPGIDLRVIVVGGKCVAAMKRTAPEGDFRANISAGGTGELYPMNNEIDFLAREAAKVCGLDIAGIDLLFDKDGYKICEANSSPGFEGFEKYCGIDVAEKITEYIKYKIQ